MRPSRRWEFVILFCLATATVFGHLVAYYPFTDLVAAYWPALVMLLPRLLVPQFL